MSPEFATPSVSPRAPATQDRPVPAAALAPQGNQAAVQDAGLDQPPCTDTSLTGPFAGLLLDGMPLGLALQVSMDLGSNPAVTDWLGRQDAAAVDAALIADPSAFSALLDRLWPRGLGLGLGAELALQLLGGLGGEGAFTLLRDDVGRLCLKGGPTYSIKEGIGAGFSVSDAFDRGAAGDAGLKAQQYLRIDLCASVEVDPAQWLAALGLGALQLAQVARAGLAGPPQIDGAALRPLLDFDPELALGARAQGRVAGQLDAPDLLPDWLRDRLLNLMRLGGSGAEGSAGFEGLARLGFELVAVDIGRVALDFKGQLSALAAAAAQLDLQVAGAPWLDLERAARRGGESQIGLRVEIDARGLSPESPARLLSTRVELSSGAQSEAAEAGSAMVFDSLDGALSALCPQAGPAVGPGPTLAEVLDSGAPSSLSRSARVDLDLARIAEELPNWVLGLIPKDLLEDERDIGLIAHDSSLALAGTQALDAADLQALAGLGIRLPAALSPAAAVAGLSEAVAALRLGQAPPPWLAPHQSAILAHFGGRPAWDEARLVGHLALGLGGSLKASALVEAKGAASGIAAIEVDRPATPDDQLQLQRRVQP